MKTINAWGVALLMCAAGDGAQAQSIEVKPVIAMGYTKGGDTLAKITIVDKEGGTPIDTITLRAGGMLDFKGGLDIRFNSRLSSQMTVGYHMDRAVGTNGNVRFERMPVEWLGHVYLTDQFRLGAGVRYAAGARLKGRGVLDDIDVSYRARIASVVESEYLFGEGFAAKLRYVSEKYERKSDKVEFDGSHFGLYMSYYFN